ncbi:MAG: inorganic phosphate transporter [Campylobacterales bacterium]|nr:inorganic phosphate transporter [Campylobacterales bacterium]
MELENMQDIEKATKHGRDGLFRLGIGVLFIVGILLYVSVVNGSLPNSTILVVAAVIGGYMAMNIGANDVANNVGPAVGSKALTLGGAIVIAAIFEASGALVAGGDVVSTIKKGIIDPGLIADPDTFIWLMLAAILAGSIWLNIATALGAPVSTTHSIVGGVLGAGIAAGGWQIANWETMGKIAASWVISPVLGGIIAAFFLYSIKRTITYKDDIIEAASKVVPVLVSIMAWAFSTYLIVKGIKKLIKIDFPLAALIGLGIAVGIYFLVKPMIKKATLKLDNSKESVNQLFTIPLIFAAALLSFAHGANDVANAVGPLAAIYDSIAHGVISKKAEIPLWIMMIGAIGIAIGLALYGPKLIKTVGSEITELNQIRAFTVAMAASITVIVASQLGLPVSSTHIAVGAVFGVGFLREYIKSNYAKMEQEIIDAHDESEKEQLEAFLEEFKKASFKQKTKMMEQIKDKKRRIEEGLDFSKKERRKIKKAYQKELVKRSAFGKIIAAWLITVPVSAIMAAMIFFMIRGFLLP